MVSKLFLTAILLGQYAIAAPINSAGVDIIADNERRALTNVSTPIISTVNCLYMLID